MKLVVTSEAGGYVNNLWADIAQVVCHPLEEHIAGRHYGADIESLVLWIRILSDEFYESGLSDREGKISFRRKDKLLHVIRAIPYNDFVNADPEKRLELVAAKILETIADSDKHRVKPKDFHKDKLYADVKEFLQSKGWLHS